MNKKIEDAAKEHVYNLVPPVNVGFMDTEEAVNYQAIRSFKAGAEWALREAIEVCKSRTGIFSSIKESATAEAIKEELKQLLSSAGEK